MWVVCIGACPSRTIIHTHALRNDGIEKSGRNAVCGVQGSWRGIRVGDFHIDKFCERDVMTPLFAIFFGFFWQGSRHGSLCPPRWATLNNKNIAVGSWPLLGPGTRVKKMLLPLYSPSDGRPGRTRQKLVSDYNATRRVHWDYLARCDRRRRRLRRGSSPRLL